MMAYLYQFAKVRWQKPKDLELDCVFSLKKYKNKKNQPNNLEDKRGDEEKSENFRQNSEIYITDALKKHYAVITNNTANSWK